MSAVAIRVNEEIKKEATKAPHLITLYLSHNILDSCSILGSQQPEKAKLYDYRTESFRSKRHLGPGHVAKNSTDSLLKDLSCAFLWRWSLRPRYPSCHVVEISKSWLCIFKRSLGPAPSQSHHQVEFLHSLWQ